jgi:hypothetical protein
MLLEFCSRYLSIDIILEFCLCSYGFEINEPPFKSKNAELGRSARGVERNSVTRLSGILSV